MGLNKVEIIGRLTAAPKGNYKDNPDGTKSLSNVWFTVASDRGLDKDAGADFVEFVAFKETAAFIMRNAVNNAKGYKPMFRQGSLVFVEGKVRTSPYEKDGEKTYKTSLVANKIEPLGKAEKLEEGSETPVQPEVVNQPAPVEQPAPQPAQAETQPITVEQPTTQPKTEQERVDEAFPFPLD